MPVELTERTEQAVDMARKAGADDVWASAERARNVGFQYRDGKLAKVQESTACSLTIRLYVAGRYSTHETTDLRKDRLEGFIAEAVALTRSPATGSPPPHHPAGTLRRPLR